MRGPGRVGLALVLLALAALAGAAPEARAAEVAGRVVLPAGLSPADVAPLVVYAEPLPGEALPRPAGGAAAVRQRDARFQPSFLAIAAGQRVAMPNEDPIYHNVFSYSQPNDFDLGLYPEGESRVVAFEHPGVVRIYCSIHESMSGLIFVSPTPWFAVVDDALRYRITGLPEGERVLRLWSPRLPAGSQRIRLEGAPLAVDLEPGAGGAAPAAPR